jgi:signal transduction histidine kinase
MESSATRHRCLVYEGSPSEQLPVIAPLLEDSLREGLRCLYLGPPAALDLMAGALWERGVNVSAEAARGALVMSAARDHLDGRGFDPAALAAGLERLVDQAVADGFTGLCATGDMAWELGEDADWRRLLEYETLLDGVFARKPLRGICQYRRDGLPAVAVGDALRSHRAVYLGQELQSQNPFYLPAEARPAGGAAAGGAALALQADWMRRQLERLSAAESERDAALKELWRANEELEKRVAERTAELEAFTHAVAHDLKAPLRSIEGFTGLIERRHGEALPPEAKELFGHVVGGARLLANLLDALLSLSRLSSIELREEEVDLSAEAERVLRRLRASEPSRTVTTVVQPGLKARGDLRLLGSLLDNLLGNAWKFTARAKDARIEVSAAADTAGRRAFVVRDNGAGFDGSQAERLFKPFQRLHSRAEFEGNGLGLTSVKRIAERHGGDAWAEGAPGKGASFYFALPGA